MKQTGKVWLVGAGPGDAGLLTIKGKQVLLQAQAIICDLQIGSSILTLLPKSAEKIYVGAYVMKQEEINALLVQKAREGLRVVRLKRGNPFLFGSGGEELLALQKNGISYEVVSGVSSVFASLAYNGIPVTQRGMSDSVHIISGKKTNDQPLKLPYDAYVDVGGTLVFLSGLSALRDIVNGLLQAGMHAHTPAAVLEKGTTGRVRRVCASLETIVEETRRIGLQASEVIIVVGMVAHLGEVLAWHEKLPLAGRRFVLTCSAEQMTELAEGLELRGAEVIELPVINAQPTGLLGEQPYIIEETAAKHYACLIFTSPVCVTSFFDLFFAAGYDARALAGVQLAAIGSGTAQALRAYGLHADLAAQAFSKKTVTALLELPISGRRTAIFGSVVGNQKLLAGIEAAAEEMGKAVALSAFPVYETALAQNGFEAFLSDAELEYTDGIFFTSAPAVRAFLQQHPQVDAGRLTALCIGVRTAQAAQEAGMCTRLAGQSSEEGLLALAEQLGGNF